MSERVPYSYEVNPRGHVWKTRDDVGSEGIDIFGYEIGNHNGPICVNCGYGFCHHCEEIPDHDCPYATQDKKE